MRGPLVSLIIYRWSSSHLRCAFLQACYLSCVWLEGHGLIYKVWPFTWSKTGRIQRHKETQESKATSIKNVYKSLLNYSAHGCWERRKKLVNSNFAHIEAVGPFTWDFLLVSEAKLKNPWAKALQGPRGTWAHVRPSPVLCLWWAWQGSKVYQKSS